MYHQPNKHLDQHSCRRFFFTCSLYVSDAVASLNLAHRPSSNPWLRCSASGRHSSVGRQFTCRDAAPHSTPPAPPSKSGTYQVNRSNGREPRPWKTHTRAVHGFSEVTCSFCGVEDTRGRFSPHTVMCASSEEASWAQPLLTG